jgi:hypothetical protein
LLSFDGVCQFVVEYLTIRNAVSMQPSPLDIAKGKLAEFKPFFDNPRYASYGTKDVLTWTYHNPNGPEETLWVPLKTKENRPLTSSKMKNNIHCKCTSVLGKRSAASTRPQISIHAPSSQPAHQRGASFELATSTRSSAEREEVIEQFAPDGTIASRHTRRESESHEETTMLKNQVIELKQELDRLVDAQQDDHEIHEAERESWNERDEEQESELAKLRREGEEERENHEEELAELRKELATMRREREEEREYHEEELAKLRKALDAEREKPKFSQQRPVQTKIVPIKDYHPVLEEKPLEFNPRTAPIKDWTADKLMAFFQHPTFKTSDDPAQWKPELVAIKDEMVRGMGDKPNFFLCEWRANEEGETTTFWMSGGFRWFSNEYDKILQAFRKEQDRIDTSWDDWNKLEEKNTQEEAKERTRNERKRKQEAEDRAEKRRTGMGSSTTPCVHVKLSTRDRTSSKLVKVQLGNAKKSTWSVRR